jgi:serine/threonine protein kinase/tetratricopeptide (TPR) repeat protein
MGIVYKARDLRLGRWVALKLMAPGDRGEESRLRFVREAQAASLLDHPNICTLYEIGETDDGRLYFAMAFCEGESLKSRLRRGPLPPRTAVQIAAQVADGLSAAHARGIVHRDIKPANLMVQGDRVKIVDFGLARRSEQTRLTREGRTVGTMAYMAPERLRGEEGDTVSDLWSLGVVLYESLTARLPFDEPGQTELMNAIVEKPPRPLIPFSGEIPPKLARVLERALEKSPASRYPSAREMRADLLAAAEALERFEPEESLESETTASGSSTLISFSPPFSDSKQRRLGSYRILAVLGCGSMGLLYLAEDPRLDRKVALKVLPPESTRNPEARRRLLEEARAASALDHPNVCTIHEVGESDDGHTYLVMPFYEGEDLASRIERGPLPVSEALDIACQTARGLAKAHQTGIVHRDLKPANLMITSDGLVKILDFGIARRPGGAEDLVPFLGTPAYLSPEQVRGEDGDAAADVWALGVVLYEMLAGRLPFRGEREDLLFREILHGEPEPLERCRKDVPAGLVRILDRMLARSPAERYASAVEVLGDLQNLTAEGMAALDPSGPPLLHNLPLPPLGDLLKGRSAELKSLVEGLEEGGSAAIVQGRTIHGLGGIGKTRLAVEYAWQHGRRYRAVLFVVAESPEGLSSGLAGLARADLLHLAERGATAESEEVAAVLRWLRENPGWLLILDNVDTREAMLAVLRLLPALTAGRVLITSRRRDWPAAVRRQSLDTISLEPATEFLLARTAEDRRREVDDEEQARRLAEMLDGLPLALEQAAAYMVHTQLSFAEYLRLWEEECDGVLGVLGWYDETVMQYPASLAVTWHRTFQDLTPTAKTVLRLAAHLAPDPIPAEMFEAGIEIVREAARLLCEETGQELRLRPIREDIAELTAFSLVSRQGEVLVVHRMVQEVIRSRIPEERKADWMNLALKILDWYAPYHSDDVNTWPIWDRLRPHVSHVLVLAVEEDLCDNALASELLTSLAVFFYGKGLYADAEPLLRKAITIEELIGRERQLVTNLINLSLVLKATKRSLEAEPFVRRALEIDRALFGKQHPQVARDLNCLGLLLMENGHYEQAEETLREALEVDENTEEGAEPALARDLHNLGLLLLSMGRPDEAEPLIRRALLIGERIHGETHPKVARKRQILASILRDLGRPDEAVPLAKEALELFESSLGPDHPSTQSAFQDLQSLLASHPKTAG